MSQPARPSGTERLLNLFTQVRPGEAPTALLLGLNRDQIRYRIEKFAIERPS